jgi:hypothetical protein
MQRHEKSKARREARLEARREADAHKVQETIEEAQLAAANAPILAEIEASQDALMKELLDMEYEWQWDREEEFGFLRSQAGDELDDPRMDDDYYDVDFDDLPFLA